MGDDEAKAIVTYLRSVPNVVRAGCALDGADAGTSSVEPDAGPMTMADAGTTMADAGTVVVDAGTSVVDAGTTVVDAGTTVADAGTSVIDAGTSVVDSGTPVVDAGMPSCSGSPVVISQVYGGGGNVNALYTNDFIELHNRSANEVNLTGWSIQYASAGGNSWKSQLSTLPNGTRLSAGAYLLIALGPTGTTGVSLPTTAITPSKRIDMSATSGKVALTRDALSLSGDCPTGGAIADFVGYGTASCAEGLSAAPALSSILSATRRSETGPEMACLDTEVNASDFAKVTPALRGSATNVCSCEWPNIAMR